MNLLIFMLRLLMESANFIWSIMYVENAIIAEPVAIKVYAVTRAIYIELIDGRVISFPADRFKILSKATNEQLKKVTLRLNGYALRWDELDEDITVKGIIAGNFQLPYNELKKA